MSHPTRARRFGARALVLTAVLTVAAAFGAGTASAAVTLDWTQSNVYDTTATAGYDRAWLGYVTNTIDFAGPNSASNGSQTPSDGATGATVTPASERGATKLFTASFPASSGGLTESSAATTVGTIQFSGKITWLIHTTPITFTNPRIVLAGDGTGKLYASGVNDTTAYTDTDPIFDLDLDGQAADPGAPVSTPGTRDGFPAASWTIGFDGTRTLKGIVPKIATPNTTAAAVFGPSYLAGVGPDRSPNRFGSFAITFAPNSGPAGAAGAAGAAGPQGPVGPAGPAGKDATVKTIKLKSALFGTKAKLVAKVTKNGKFVGYAEVSGKKLKVTYITATLKGKFKLTEVGGKKRVRSATLG